MVSILPLGFFPLERRGIRLWLVPFLALLSVGISGSVQDGVRVLDLTRSDPPNGRPAGWGGGSPMEVVEGQPFIISHPLRYSLRGIAPKYARSGAGLTYEAGLRNVGSKSMRIPWDPDWPSIQGGRKGPPTGYLSASLSLVARDAKGRTLVLARHGLYGSSLKPGSLLELAPGEEVLFRAPGSWPTLELDDTGQTPEFDVHAEFTFLYGPGVANTERRYVSDAESLVLKPSP